MSRSGAVTFKGTPLTLAGEAVKVGQQAPDFTVHYFEGGLKTDQAGRSQGKAGVHQRRAVARYARLPDADQEVQRAAAALGDRVNAVTVSLDLPFAMNRFCGAESIKNMKVGSDYKTAISARTMAC